MAIAHTRLVLKVTIDKSVCFGGYIGNVQVAFARVTVLFAYLLDVIVFPLY